MSHEILEHDKLVLLKEPAWHGLGTIVKDARTAMETLPHAPGDWLVEQYELAARLPIDPTAVGEVSINYQPVASHVMNVRSDTKTQLGIVSRGYRPIQNRELASFVDALVEQDDKIKVESAGSIRNGQKVWFLVKGESFSVRGKDEVAPYILVSNGHDGGTALRCTPTTVRVVCSNTLHMVIPNGESEFVGVDTKLRQGIFIAHHTATVMQRVEEAKKALQLYGKSMDATREVIDLLAAKDASSEAVKKFFLECYVRDFGAIPVNALTARELTKRQKATEAMNKMWDRYEKEVDIAGATWWNALNAVTGYEYHDRPMRLKDAALVAERKIESRLFGVDVERAHKTVSRALTLAS